MAYLVVFLVAAAVGVGVYAITLRNPAPTAADFAGLPEPTPEDAGARSLAGTRATVTVSGWRPDWQSRLTGFLGLLVAVVLGAGAVAFLSYVVVKLLVAKLGG